MGKNDGRPKGKMSSYAFFVQTCREEHKKKHPGEQVQFSDFSKKCSEKWKAMSAKEKKRFEEMADKDKKRFENEVANAPKGKGSRGGKRKRTKDPNAPKRALSAFFLFCSEERPLVKKKHPRYTVGDIAKELGKRWEACQDRGKFEEMAVQDRARYDKEMKIYKAGGVIAKAKAKTPKKKKSKKEEDDEDDEEEEEDEDEEEEEEEEDDTKEENEEEKKESKKVSKKEGAKKGKDDEDGEKDEEGDEEEEEDDGAREDSEE